MATRFVDRDAIGHDEDWQGNNAAFTCPACKKVYIVSARMHAEGRDCPTPPGAANREDWSLAGRIPAGPLVSRTQIQIRTLPGAETEARGASRAICQSGTRKRPQGHPRACPRANEGQGHGHRRQDIGEGPRI